MERRRRRDDEGGAIFPVLLTGWASVLPAGTGVQGTEEGWVITRMGKTGTLHLPFTHLLKMVLFSSAF